MSQDQIYPVEFEDYSTGTGPHSFSSFPISKAEQPDHGQQKKLKN